MQQLASKIERDQRKRCRQSQVIIMEEKPHFFKFIFPGFNKKLSIPISFLSNLVGENLHGGEAILKTSYDVAGRSWRVKVMNGRYFEDGWEEFALHNDLHVGYLLLFRQEGGLDFHVKVFDLSACEKQYCLPPAAPLNENEGGTRRKIIKKENSDGNHNDTSSCSDADQPQHVRRSTVKAKEAPNFTKTIQHYNFRFSSMNIPIALARSNGLVGRNRLVTLKNEMGKCWQVTTVTYKNSRYLKVYIQNGWREFSDANKLSTGDVCTFDLLSTGENVVMKVTIKKHKKSKISNKTKKRATLYKDLDSLDVSSTPRLHVKRDKEGVPCFTAKIKLTNLSQNCMNIPMSFARSNGLTDSVCMINLMNTSGRCWQVNLRYKQSSGNVYMRSGWRKFSDDNELNMGDICTFRLLSTGENVVMEVTITKHKKDNGSSDMTKKRVTSKNLDSSSVAASPLLTMDAEETPYFTVKLQDHHKHVVYVPMNFARSNGILRNCMVTLKNGMGKCWQLRMRYTERKYRVAINWHEFLDANKLSTGDVCNFKLLSNGKKVVMDVIITKRKEDQNENKTKKRLTSEDFDSSSRAATPSLIKNAESTLHFTVKLKRYNISQAIMHIPIAFAISNGLTERNCMIALIDKKGLHWQVSLGYKKSYRDDSSQVCIGGGGWREFSAANRLRIGDVCTFELISSGKNVVMKATVSHTTEI